MKNKPVEIIIHCSATRINAGRRYTVDQLRKDHLANGWSDIGYHYYITVDGIIHRCRPISQVGAHCLGHNNTSIGVCYEGGLDSDMHPSDTRTSAQKNSLNKLIFDLKLKYPIKHVYGHRDFAKKSCPCFDAHLEYDIKCKF